MVSPAMMHALTIDVEDWPQSTLDHALPITERAATNTRRMLEVLQRHEVRATFFVQGMMAEKFPELVAEIAAGGHEIGSHGYSHRSVLAIGPSGFADELTRSVRLLESITGRRVLGYRAPDFSIVKETLWAQDILADRGLLYDSSIFPVQTARYGIGDAPRGAHLLANGLTELPLSTVEWLGRRWPVAGGGYLRLYPYPITRWAIQRLEGQAMPAVVYMHPYELDATELDQIAWPVPNRLRLSQGLNRRYVQGRLERLLREFRFGPAAEVLKLSDFASTLPQPASSLAAS